MEMADFAVSQFFFEIDEYVGFVEDLAARGIHKPVLPGIMPVTTLRSVPRMAQMGAAVPGWEIDRLEAAHADGGDEAVRRRGCRHGHRTVPELLAAGAPGLHFYTLNRSSATREIYNALDLGSAR